MPRALQLQAGKLASRPPLSIASAAGPPSTVMYIHNKHDNTRFLIDSGADVSLLPATAADRVSNDPAPPLAAANGTPIKSFGRKTMLLQLHDRKFTATFITADVPAAILGADFLRDNRLLVDMGNRCLIDTRDYGLLPCTTATNTHHSISVVDAPPCRYRQLLIDRPALTTPTFKSELPAHGVQMHIPTTGPPVFAKARRLSPEKLEAAKKEFSLMEQLGIIRRSKSPWASPLHIVPKKDGGHRPCGDFRRLNDVTTPDKYPIPYLSDATHFLEGKIIFSKIDLIRGYHQIPVAPEDIPKTAVITPFGLYEWVRTPFGLKNAAQAFQRLMDRVGSDLDFIFIYLDDILVASSSEAEHIDHLNILFSRLEQFGLVVNPAKCIFGVQQLEFLGHIISAAGSAPTQEKIEAVQNFPTPATVGDLLVFIGMLQFYNKYLPKINLVLRPLFDEIAGKKKAEKVNWSEHLDHSFQQAKSALSSATLLSHPKLNAITALTTDASDHGAGAVLEQYVDKQWVPLAFFSKKFRPAQTKYSAYDRELLAIHLAIRHFRYFLEGRNFTVFTDHKPISLAITKKAEAATAIQSRWLSAISSFTTDIRHVQGKDNPVADALSRHSPPSPPPPPTPATPDNKGQLLTSSATVSNSATDLPALAVAQENDQSLQQFVLNYTGTKLKLCPVKLPDSDRKVICEMSRAAPRPLVPDALRRPITLQLHGLSHPGSKATTRLVKERFFWPNMAKEIKATTSTCVACQRAKTLRHYTAPAEFIAMPGARFQHIHIDIVGPLPPSQGCSHLLTIVDRFTRWPEAIPVPDTNTATLCQALQFHWISRFGPPLQMTSDRGAQFTSAMWSHMSESLGIRLSATTAYHPNSNGMVERMHRRLKEALKSRLTSPNWMDQLPWVLLGLRTTIKEDLLSSPAELVYGTPIAIPGDCLPINPAPTTADHLRALHNTVQQLRPTATAHHAAPNRQAVRLPPNLRHVFVRRDGHRPPLAPVYDGPFEVVGQTNKVVKIKKGEAVDSISVDRCKPAILEEKTAMQAPPRRGRPAANQRNSNNNVPLTDNHKQVEPDPPLQRRSQREARGVPPSRLGLGG